MNTVALIGRLTKDPELKYTTNSLAIVKATVAVTRYVKDGDNTADFIPVSVFGKQAEILEKYARKGNRIGITGRINTSSYEDKDGRTVYKTDVVANNIELLEKKEKKETESKQDGGYAKFDDSNEDVPF